MMCSSNSLPRRRALPTRSQRRVRRLTCRLATIIACTCWRLPPTGDQKATFQVGGKKVDLNIQDWGGFIGQWDDRQWSSGDTSSDNYGKMIGLTRPTSNAPTWHGTARITTTPPVKMLPYSYSYLFAYPIDLPEEARTITLPNNDKIRILAMSVGEENPELKPTQPLYDLFAPPPAGADDFAIHTQTSGVSVYKSKSGTAAVSIIRRGNFRSSVSLSISGLPRGVTASFSPATTERASKLTLTADNSSDLATSTITITGVAGSLSHTVSTPLTVAAIKTGTVAVDLSSVFNKSAIHSDGSRFSPQASADGEGFAYSKEALGSAPLWDGVLFNLGPADVPDAVTGRTVTLPAGKFASIKLLATGVEGRQESQIFTITYADGTSSSVTQDFSDWYEPSAFPGESEAIVMPYRLAEGSRDDRTFYLYGYSFNLDSSKPVRSITSPSNERVLVFAMTLVPPSGS